MTSDDLRAAAKRLTSFIRGVSSGGCQMYSRGDACECLLCDVDCLWAAAQPPGDGEAVKVESVVREIDARMMADARRYRWLRDNFSIGCHFASGDVVTGVHWSLPDGMPPEHATLDAAIDAAMAESERQRVLRAAEEDISPLDDGSYCFWIKDKGAMSAWSLRVVADELDRRTNAAMGGDNGE